MENNALATLLNPDRILADSLEFAFGLKKYVQIMQMAEDGRFDDEFRKLFKSYYIIRQRSSDWYDKFFQLMEEQRSKQRSFEELLKEMYEVNGSVEVSFASKLMATIDKNKPIWDRYVLTNLGHLKKWSALQSAPYQKRINEAATIYADIEQNYLSFLDSPEGQACIRAFNDTMPQYDKISDIKKIDFFLWSKR